MKLGYVTADEDMFIPVQEVKKYPKREVAILTGDNHGEPLAALTRIAKQGHKQLDIEEGDTVLIASSPIPGQEACLLQSGRSLNESGRPGRIRTKTRPCIRPWLSRRAEADAQLAEAEVFNPRKR